MTCLHLLTIGIMTQSLMTAPAKNVLLLATVIITVIKYMHLIVTILLICFSVRAKCNNLRYKSFYLKKK